MSKVANAPEGTIRPDGSGKPSEYNYDATSSGPVAGWMKCDDAAGEIGPDGVGHGHFSSEAGPNPGPWKQT